MIHLEFKTTIDAPASKVWKVMLSPDTYKEWVEPSWPGSYYVGHWSKGQNIKFLASQGGGTLARIEESDEYKTILANHIAVIRADGSEDTASESATSWIGTQERYTFEEDGGKTTVRVDIDTTPEWENMFTEGWPAALKKLKEVSERQSVHS
jgi:uncharacterized protein YndB with AHSA1/START domain